MSLRWVGRRPSRGGAAASSRSRLRSRSRSRASRRRFEQADMRQAVVTPSHHDQPPPRPPPGAAIQPNDELATSNRALRRHVWQVVAAGVSERLRLNRYRRKVVHIISPVIASKLGKRCVTRPLSWCTSSSSKREMPERKRVRSEWGSCSHEDKISSFSAAPRSFDAATPVGPCDRHFAGGER